MDTKVNQKYNEARDIFKKELDLAISEIVNKNPEQCLEIKNNAAEETLTEKSLREGFKHCDEKPFTIAVCGQVKAGKSTLLNSLIFGDEVLPSFITPETAKLAFISYTDELSSFFKVNWYTADEWREVRHSTNSESLNKRVSYSASHKSHPVFQQNCIGREPQRINDLSQLDQYTSVPKEGEKEDSLAGIYTPFVKSVEIYINNENLKNLRIVDTPGLNDPNRINSNETTKNLNEAHAIIYVCPVTLFHQPDLDFFEQFMKGKTENTRVIVQNRIDDECESYLSNVNDCKKNQDCLNMGLFGDNEIVCSYSAKINLAKAKSAKGKASETDLDYLEWYKDFDADPNNLAQQISERLFNNSGRARLESLAAICIKPYNAQIILLEEEIKCKEFEKIKNTDPIEKVEKELEKLKSNRSDIYKKNDDTKNKFTKEQRAIINSLRKIIDNDKNNQTLQSFVETKYGEGKYERVKACLPHEWIKQTKDMCRRLEDDCFSRIINLQDEMQDSVDRIINDIKASAGRDVDKIITNYAQMEWRPPKAEKIEMPEYHWYTFKSNELSQILGAVNKAWDAFIEELEKYVDKVDEYLKDVQKKIYGEIQKKLGYIEAVLEKRVKTKNALDNRVKEIEASIESKKAEIKRHQGKIKELEQLANTYKEKV